MAIDRLVGRLYCHEVLERLSEYLDGELPPHARAEVAEHLAGCDVCERFGGLFANAVQALRGSLPPPAPQEHLPEGLLKRLGS
jgi:anti-sigma factor RsiW